MKYDAVAVLSSQPDPETWLFPQPVYDSLDRARDLFVNRRARRLIVSGGSSLALANRGIIQPFRDCDPMANYLTERGIPDAKILREGDSKDSISNLYYVKRQLLVPYHIKSVLFTVADFRIPRLQFLCQRIWGDQYQVDFESIPTEPGSFFHDDEAHTLKVQKAFLAPMQDGDDSWLDGKFYTAPIYNYWREIDTGQLSRAA